MVKTSMQTKLNTSFSIKRIQYWIWRREKRRKTNQHAALWINGRETRTRHSRDNALPGCRESWMFESPERLTAISSLWDFLSNRWRAQRRKRGKKKKIERNAVEVPPANEAAVILLGTYPATPLLCCKILNYPSISEIYIYIYSNSSQFK